MSDVSEIRRLLAALPPELRESMREAANSGLDALRKPEDIGLPCWAHRHFYLSAESSQREEKWRAWPLQIGVLHIFGDDGTEEAWWYKSARVGASKCLLADIAYTAQHQRRNQGLWLPTDSDRDDYVKTDLDPMLRDVAIMRTVFPRSIAKSKDNTLQQKKFLGSLLKLRGGQAAGNYRRLTLAKARADEIDGFEQSVEGAGTPDTLIKKRVEGATYPKVSFVSTGRKKGTSHIERGHDSCEVRIQFCIECPHCKADHPLMWGGKDENGRMLAYGFRWDKEDPEGTVRHLCPHCHGAITQADYLMLARTGRWISRCGNFVLRHWWNDEGEPFAQWTLADGTPCSSPKRVGIHCWTAYSESPGVTWGSIVRDFLNARRAMKEGNRAPMVQWVNETKGETYEEESEKADVSALQTRAKRSGHRMRVVPRGCLLLAGSVDVQTDRFEIAVWGIGRESRTWVIDYIVIEANTAVQGAWDQVWQVLRQQYQHQDGAWMSLAGAAIDTGHQTHLAYAFVAKYRDVDPNFKVYAIKGSSQDGDPIKARSAQLKDINLHGKAVKRGVKLWIVGTDTAKDLLFGRLKVTEEGPGYVSFAKDLPDDFFRHFGNEKRIPVTVQGKTIYRWIHFRGNNEALDLAVYCLFMFEALDVAKFTERRWQELERQVEPTLFDVTEREPDNAAKPATLEEGGEPEPATTRPQPQKPPAAATPKPTAPTAANSIASDSWLSRDRF